MELTELFILKTKYDKENNNLHYNTIFSILQ